MKTFVDPDRISHLLDQIRERNKMENDKPWLAACKLRDLLEDSRLKLIELTNSNFKRGDAIKFQHDGYTYIGIVTSVRVDGTLTVIYRGNDHNGIWDGNKIVFIGDVIDKMEL